MKNVWLILGVLLGLALLTGCGATKAAANGAYSTVGQDPRRDTAAADKKNEQALQLIHEGKLEEAEALLKSALEDDVLHGPVHNNLGKTYYLQTKYYLAAWEFQYAAKLMPKSCEPRNNLGLVFERVGRLDEAIDWYNQAMTLEPGNPELIGNLARACVRRGDKDQKVRQLLADLLLKDTRPEWTSWAKLKLATLGGPPTTMPAN